MNYHNLLKLSVNAALKAGEEILRIYNTDFDVETKSDNTPVTTADKASGQCISAILLQSGIPVISEEEDVTDFNVRKNWQQVWIVDPLDGTKEYIKRNGEFAGLPGAPEGTGHAGRPARGLLQPGRQGVAQGGRQ